MFRYIGLIWDPADAAQAACARQLGEALHSRADWLCVLVRPGCQVHATGLRPGLHDAYVLEGTQGVVLGRLFGRDGQPNPVAGDLRLSPDEKVQLVHYQGRPLLQDFWGRHVAFLADADGGTRVLRDLSGALPCHRLQHAGMWIVFSWLEDVLTLLPGIPMPAVDWHRLAAHIAFVSLSGRETALQGVWEVLPGESLRLGAGPPAPDLLWNAATVAGTAMQAARGADIDLEQAARTLRRTVRDCARSWAACHDRILLRLSGGVDSAILLGCLGGTAASLTCVNYHSPGANSDERAYARLAAARAGCELIERERDGAFRLERVLDVARTPLPPSYLGRMGTPQIDAELANQLGASALFTGGGGDQLFFEFRGWWPAADYLRCRGLDGGFLGAAMDAARLARWSVWRTLRRVAADRLGFADPERAAEPHLMLAARDALPGPDQRGRHAHPALLEAHGLPIGKRIQLEQLLYPLDGYDPYLRETAPDLVNPLLSQPVIEACLALPTYVLTYGGRGRALARRAFATDLPPEIGSRRSKGGMEEHVTHVLQHNLDFARQLLLDGQLVARGLLDRRRLEAVLGGRPTTLAAHTGEVHGYIGIEAWLQRCSGSGRSTRGG